MPTLDLSCMPCCGGSSSQSSVSAVCCPGVPDTLFATLSSDGCECFNYTVELTRVDTHRWQSAGYDDPCSEDITGLVLLCDEETGTYTLEKLTSAPCGWAGATTPATFVQCEPFEAHFSVTLAGIPGCDCADGNVVNIVVTE